MNTVKRLNYIPLKPLIIRIKTSRGVISTVWRNYTRFLKHMLRET